MNDEFLKWLLKFGEFSRNLIPFMSPFFREIAKINSREKRTKISENYNRYSLFESLKIGPEKFLTDDVDLRVHACSLWHWLLRSRKDSIYQAFYSNDQSETLHIFL